MKPHKNNAQLAADARGSLLGHLGTAVWSLLLYGALSLFLEQIAASFVFSNTILNLAGQLAAHFVTSLFSSLFGIGLASVFLNLQYGQPAYVRDLFRVFRENPDKSVQVRAFVTLGESVCLLPLQLILYFTPDKALSQRLPAVAVCGAVSMASFLIWSLTYSMANYLLLDFPDMEAGRILRAARSLMRGNRARLFLLQLRLVPLHLLSVFSFGLASLWAGSCQYACTAAFYRDLIEMRASES